jgi:hypothetical protein
MVIVGLALLLLVGCTGGGGTSKYAVSGTVTGVDGDGIKGVALSFEGFGTAETDEDGKWRKDGLSGTVKVSPAKDGWAFEPSSRTVSKADSSVNFVATMLEYPLTIQVQGEGTVNQEVLVAAQGTEYEHGTQVQLTAVPATGWRFSHWEGDLDGNENPATIVVDSEKSVTAVFVILEYALNLTIEGEGTVNQEVLVAAQGIEYEHGTQVQLTAVPSTGWTFSHWEGDLEGSSELVVVAMDSSKNVTAVFAEQDDRDYMGLALGATWVYKITSLLEYGEDSVEEYFTGEGVMRVIAVDNVGDDSIYTIEETLWGQLNDGTTQEHTQTYQWLKDSHDRYYDIYQTDLELILEAPLEIGSTIRATSVVRQETLITPLGERDAWIGELRREWEDGSWNEFKLVFVPYLGFICSDDLWVEDGLYERSSLELISYSINEI